MSSRLSHTIISLLVILVVSLGTSIAGSPVCPPKCPDCVVVPACCADMDDSSASGTKGAADHSSGWGGCSHDRICHNDFQPIDVSAVGGTFEYDNAFIQSHLGSQIHHNIYYKATVRVLPEPPLENSPPLFLRNCSFLI